MTDWRRRTPTSRLSLPSRSPVRLRVCGASRLRVQADGELLGPTPTEISIIPKALTLLVAPDASWQQASG